jgi:hypothetical protein
MQLGFWMVGRTPKDVDAMVANFSESLIRNLTYTLPALMSVLMKARTSSAAFCSSSHTYNPTCSRVKIF